MSDQEMLELAASVAGRSYEHGKDWHDEGQFYVDGRSWNALTDDGDALRLAVKLNMLVDVMTAPVQSHAFGGFPGKVGEAIEPHTSGDKYAATRRAIVRAAAEIAKVSA